MLNRLKRKDDKKIMKNNLNEAEKERILQNFLKQSKQIIYKPKFVSQLFGLSKKTLDRYDKNGILIASRTDTDRRYYTLYQILEFLQR